ncbi:MAG: sulfite exporter TauE/SafE family protein [Clostridia bacterium]|nr:sulfite exporter TauE/SafE family protein [Clostridia bacterium]
MIVVNFLIGVATGIVSGFGIGGGSLLVLYLTAFGGISQYTAGGINLLYFIGCAPAALIGHIRQKNIAWKAVLWCGLAGISVAIPTSLLAANMDTDLLRRLFGVLLLYIGVKELRAGKHNK